MLLDSIVKLHDKIQNMKLGVNRERQITELEQARLRRLPLLTGVPGGGSLGDASGLVEPKPGDHQ
jgi:NADH-quinone oxidoreductase subunit B